MTLSKYSIGIGDRFGRQGAAQLDALQRAQAAGVMITPVWNKSNREHQIIGTTPADTHSPSSGHAPPGTGGVRILWMPIILA